MSKTKIEWCQRPGTTGETWNPIQDKRKGKSGRGYHCTKCSPGCLHCWAETMNQRFGNALPFDSEPTEFEIIEGQYRRPEHWKKPRTVFVESMGDLFHDAIPYDLIDRVIRMIASHPKHLFIILTKRAKRARHYFTRGAFMIQDRKGACMHGGFDESGVLGPLPNLWIGVTVCNQDETWKIGELLRIPAAKRFVSIEPMLGPVDLRPYLHCGLSWCIIGCETGPNARPMKDEWARGVIEQCKQRQIPVFYKQQMVSGKMVKTPKVNGRRYAEFPSQKES